MADIRAMLVGEKQIGHKTACGTIGMMRHGLLGGHRPLFDISEGLTVKSIAAAEPLPNSFGTDLIYQFFQIFQTAFKMFVLPAAA